MNRKGFLSRLTAGIVAVAVGGPVIKEFLESPVSQSTMGFKKMVVDGYTIYYKDCPIMYPIINDTPLQSYKMYFIDPSDTKIYE